MSGEDHLARDITVRKFLLSLCLFTLGHVALAPAASFPSGLVPFTSIYYISAPDANGNRLVEGTSNLTKFFPIRSLPTSNSHQQFLDSTIQLAPGQYFSHVYLPTANELQGDFSDISLPLINPYLGIPFPENIIPETLLDSVFAFVIGPTSTSLTYVPVTPCRISDTRGAAGPFGAPFIAGNSSRNVAIPSSSCNIPAASAYSLNVTVIPHGPLGYLTAWPTGQSQPLVSTLNSLDGRVKANAAIVTAGLDGAVSFYASNDTDLVIDINGYFVPASTHTGLAFYPSTPCRISDTRTANGALGGPALLAGQSRDFPILQSSCNLPPSAQAYALNLTAVPQNANPLGYLSAWPAGQTEPLVSTLNAQTGVVTANSAILPAGTNGDVSVFASNNTDLVIDLNGYFAPPGAGALYFNIVSPCRVLDTRSTGSHQPFSGTLSIQVVNTCNVPLNASAVLLNATAVPSAPLGYLTLFPYGSSQPLTSNLNSSDGAIVSNMVIVPTLSGAITAFATNPTHLILDITGYFAP